MTGVQTCALPIWASRVHDLPLKQRVAGIDLVEEVLDSDRTINVYLLGSKPGVAEKAGDVISRKYEGIEIAGTHHGYIPVENDEIVSEINAKNPDLLLVGMGVPKQEKWIIEHIDSLSANVVMGVGGSFDVFSGNLPRAPRWMRARCTLRERPTRKTTAQTAEQFDSRVTSGGTSSGPYAAAEPGGVYDEYHSALMNATARPMYLMKNA